MTLKHVHVFFIAVATIVALLSAVVAFRVFQQGPTWAMGGAAAGALLGAALLVRYEAGFLKRCREAGL